MNFLLLLLKTWWPWSGGPVVISYTGFHDNFHSTSKASRQPWSTSSVIKLSRLLCLVFICKFNMSMIRVCCFNVIFHSPFVGGSPPWCMSSVNVISRLLPLLFISALKMWMVKSLLFKR